MHNDMHNARSAARLADEVFGMVGDPMTLRIAAGGIAAGRIFCERERVADRLSEDDRAALHGAFDDASRAARVLIALADRLDGTDVRHLADDGAI